ncbi:hypothetical protein P3X46_003253 [Hevea brasiliensis]|uniref:DUF761 domain-containing protein n=1 Tax=Hevea brasiliensis TaxID=3981 RepID=A0ABQ9N910_HEVBR|nr:uncharacterized protein LOC110659210 [Hevea brasiliensis]KAJ9187838.1 hypothetical protein P3X46_003253 [Hevea brasiliensis]
MEYSSSKIGISSAAFTPNNKGHFDRDGLRKKKKRSLIRLIRLASYVLKLKKSNKSKCAPFNATSIWKKFVGSMRPLYLQSHQSPSRLMVMEAPPTPLRNILDVDHQEVLTPPISPAYASAASSSCGMSQYASATNLQELDQVDECEENEEENGLYDDTGGDEMIDVKAEQFIAQFYQQMRLQREASQKTGI